MHLIFGDKLDSHAPTSIGGEQLPELLQRQFLLIDLNDCLVVLIVVDQAAQHTTPGDPLITLGIILDLCRPQGHFDRNVLVFRKKQ